MNVAQAPDSEAGFLAEQAQSLPTEAVWSTRQIGIGEQKGNPGLFNLISIWGFLPNAAKRFNPGLGPIATDTPHSFSLWNQQ
jgi:hypothetical protein